MCSTRMRKDRIVSSFSESSPQRIARYGWLGSICRYENKRGLSLGLLLPPLGSTVTKDRINLRQSLRIIKSQYPALLGRIVHVEQTQQRCGLEYLGPGGFTREQRRHFQNKGRHGHSGTRSSLQSAIFRDHDALGTWGRLLRLTLGTVAVFHWTDSARAVRSGPARGTKAGNVRKHVGFRVSGPLPVLRKTCCRSCFWSPIFEARTNSARRAWNSDLCNQRLSQRRGSPHGEQIREAAEIGIFRDTCGIPSRGETGLAREFEEPRAD